MSVADLRKMYNTTQNMISMHSIKLLFVRKIIMKILQTIIILLALVQLCCKSGSRNKESVIACINWHNNTTCYYVVENDSIKDDIVFLFIKNKQGIIIKDEPLSISLNNNIKLSKTYTIAIKNEYDIGNSTNMQQYFYDLFLCIGEASKKEGVASLKWIPFNTFKFSEVAIPFTDNIRQQSVDPENPTDSEIERCIEMTSLRKDFNKVLNPYGLEVDKMQHQEEDLTFGYRPLTKYNPDYEYNSENNKKILCADILITVKTK